MVLWSEWALQSVHIYLFYSPDEPRRPWREFAKTIHHHTSTHNEKPCPKGAKKSPFIWSVHAINLRETVGLSEWMCVIFWKWWSLLKQQQHQHQNSTWMKQTNKRRKCVLCPLHCSYLLLASCKLFSFKALNNKNSLKANACSFMI